jgi:hypothetical protein
MEGNMLKLTRLSLFELALFASPAIAACDFMLPSLTDLPTLVECVKSQGYEIALHADQIRGLQKELDGLRHLQGLYKRDVEKLNDRLFELRTEVALLRLQKTKPAK